MRTRIPIVSVAFVAAAAAAPALAAPQIMGVVASVEPTPLVCQNGMCSAQLSTFCLQQKRAVPSVDTVYSIHGGKGISLVLTKADGSRETLPAEGNVMLSTPRGISAINVSVPEWNLTAMGAVAAEVWVDRNVSLVPAPTKNDPDPLTEMEIAYVTGPLREGASPLFEGDAERPLAARIVNKLINATPRHGRYPGSRHKDHWQKVMGSEPVDSADPGVQRAVDVFRACTDSLSWFYFSLRRCLEAKHDDLMRDINGTYWTSVGAGS
jgi:hypothetical protein